MWLKIKRVVHSFKLWSMYAQMHYMTILPGVNRGRNTEDSQRFNFHRWHIVSKRFKQRNNKQMLQMVYIWILFLKVILLTEIGVWFHLCQVSVSTGTCEKLTGYNLTLLYEVLFNFKRTYWMLPKTFVKS